MKNILPAVIVAVPVAAGIAIYMVYVHNEKKVRANKIVRRLRADADEDVLEARIETQEQTFEFVSRDIHDNICQKLSVARLLLRQIPRTAEHDPADADQLIATAMADLRDLSHSLSNDMVLSQGLVGALENEISVLKKSNRFSITLTVTGELVFSEIGKDIMLYRICQEGIQNIIKHADATEAAIVLAYNPDTLVISIHDNGKGFRDRTPTGGLHNMQLRAKKLGGDCRVESSDRGTRITVQIPIKNLVDRETCGQ